MRSSDSAVIEPYSMSGSGRSLTQRWATVSSALEGRTALQSAGMTYTYGAADALSDAVAAQLVRALAHEEASTPVALFVDHDAAGVVGLLSLMKAQRIVVFLDKHLPLARMQQIVELAGVRSCVAVAGNLATATEIGGSLSNVLSLDELMSSSQIEGAALSTELANAGVTQRCGSDPVAIVFTSGSTGRPKGVIQTHDQILNEVVTSRERFGTSHQDRAALVLPYGFAAGLYLIFSSLLNGASVYSFDPRDGGTRGLISVIVDNAISTMVCSPHLARSLVSALAPEGVLDSLRYLCTTGEAIHGRDVRQIRGFLPAQASFFNWTGSSEMAGIALYEIAPGADVPDGVLPAGLATPNKDLWLLAEDGSRAPTGEVGEVVCVSNFMSGGYWQDDKGNAERFSLHTDGRKICRQGDLGRFDDRGNLILLGRSDAAVKVRGYLVEPSEVEAAFLAESWVKEVVVTAVVDPPAPTRLVAYVVPAAGSRTVSPAAMRRQLRARLPEYMVPTTIKQLAELPRNERGKVDRPNLPAVPAADRSHPPVAQWEVVMADLWSTVLGLDFVGLDDDFMSLGGDSLTVEEMLAGVQERFGVALRSADLIESPTLKEFTRRVVQGTTALPKHPDVVTLQSGGSQTPLFCFAGSGALALTFVPVSQHFADRPIYAFQAHGLERRGIPDWSVNAAAMRFIEMVRVIRPHGPYLLLGHSFGGLVALEMARLLQNAGEEVALVGLLDTYLPRNRADLPVMDFGRMAPPQVEASRWQSVKTGGLQLVHRALPDGLPAMRQWGRQSRAYLAGVLKFSGQTQFDAFFDHGLVTGRHYRLQPYSGRTLVVLADGNPDGPDTWKPLLTGPHTIVEIHSEHSSLLREPYAGDLAKAVQQELTQVESAEALARG